MSVETQGPSRRVLLAPSIVGGVAAIADPLASFRSLRS